MAEQPTLGRMGQQFTDPLDSLLRCATMLWNHDSSLRVVWILFFSPYSSGTLFATPFSIVTLLFALFEPCLINSDRPFFGDDLFAYEDLTDLDGVGLRREDLLTQLDGVKIVGQAGLRSVGACAV